MSVPRVRTASSYDPDFDFVSPEYSKEVSVIPRNIVTERLKNLENLFPQKQNSSEEIAADPVLFKPPKVS